MMSRSLPALLLLPLTACGGADESIPDAAPEAPDAAAITCEAGATASATIGADGGELALCGARLTVLPAALTDDVAFSITQIDAPEAAPFERTFAGEVFRFAADVEPLTALVSIDVPAADGDGYLYLYRHDGTLWNTVEACRAEPGSLGQNVGVLGDYVAMRHTVVFPGNSNGLGEGDIDVTLDATPYPFTLDEASRGYFDESADGTRAITLYLWYTPAGGDLKVLDLTFAVPGGDAAPEVVATSWIDLGGADYSYINHLTQGTSTIALGPATLGDRYEGVVNVTFVDDEAVEHDLTATFDVTVEPYEFPPELSCPGEGGE